MYKGPSIKLRDDFSSSTMESKRQWDDIFKVLTSRIPHPAKLFFKNEEVKIFMDKQKQRINC